MNDSAATIFDRGLEIVVRRAKVFLLIAFLGGIAGVAVSYLFTPVFRAEAILVPSEELFGLGENSELAALGGLATLVGAGNGQVNKETEAVAILRSRTLTYAYIESHSLLPILFAAQWNPLTKQWKSKKIPTIEDGYAMFDNIRAIVENRKNGLITIAITWKDPSLAKQWVDGLVDTTNDFLRNQALERSTRNLEYLKKASEQTPIVEVKAAIYKLMEAEIKKQMTALGSKDYAFRVVDPAVVPEHKSAPKRSSFAAFGAVASSMAWFLVIVIRTRMIAVASLRPNVHTRA
jgi:uncharacterized protein involved in exopolysaccharide biosynthesis